MTVLTGMYTVERGMHVASPASQVELNALRYAADFRGRKVAATTASNGCAFFVIPFAGEPSRHCRGVWWRILDAVRMNIDRNNKHASNL